MNRIASSLLATMAAVTLTSCVPVKPPASQPTGTAPASSLWQRKDVARQDLFLGPWGAEHAPDPNAVYRFVERKHSGVNPGLTVVDPEGREWSVKQSYPGAHDPEGPVEVTVSRVLSAVGYHQPPVYYLPSFRLKDDWGEHIERGGRFRPKLKDLKEKGSWSWAENPFIGTTPFNGLEVLLLMFNSTDLKDSNNSLYEYRTGDFVEEWYVARDLGAALGDMNRFAPFKADPDAFEKDPFILDVRGPYVEFAYKGWYKDYVRDRITPGEVRWASNLLSQLSDKQWQDAFRAGGFDPVAANRFIRKLHEKIDEGLAVGSDTVGP